MVPPGHNPADPLPCDDEGKCTCLRNVIGDKCDSCRDTYWNVGSGFGCEECMCDPTGSLNNSCDVTTGQCPCKPGVTGRTCDQCQADHYSFSSQGCLREFLLLFSSYFTGCERYSRNPVFDLTWFRKTPNFLTGYGWWKKDAKMRTRKNSSPQKISNTRNSNFNFMLKVSQFPRVSYGVNAQFTGDVKYSCTQTKRM